MANLVKGIAIAVIGISARIAAAEPEIYIDKGVCPFECCRYGRWEAETPVSLYDRPNGSKIVASIRADEVVTALTGEIHSPLIPTRMIKADPMVKDIQPGDVVFFVSPTGEGYWRVLFKGQIIDGVVPENFETGRLPDWTWWIQIKTKSGKMGWTKENRSFTGNDACG